MGWDDVPGWLSAIAAVVATAFAGLSWWSSRKSKASETEAKNQADRATKAAENAATAQQQTADEAKRLADIAENRAKAAESKPWAFQKAKSGMATLYHLVNTTPTPKYGVKVSGGGVLGSRGQLGPVDGHGTAKINLLDSWQITDRTITISWFRDQEQTGEPLTQHTELT
jgi:hypothetical protein